MIYPTINENRTKPDFLIESSSGTRYVLEGTLITGVSRKVSNEDKLLNKVIDALDQMDSPDFFLHMRVRGTPRTQPPTNRIIKYLETELEKYDPDEIYQIYKDEGLKLLPQINYSHDGCDLTFIPIPKKPSSRGKTGIRPIGSRITGFKRIDTISHIKDAVNKKSRQYGCLDMPYIVAVNILDKFVEPIDIIQAVYGTLVGYQDNDVVTIHNFNGIWGCENKPKMKRVSAILAVERLTPWNITNSPIRLYHNPWTKFMDYIELSELPHAYIKNKQLDFQDGNNIGSLLNLPPGWPE